MMSFCVKGLLGRRGGRGRFGLGRAVGVGRGRRRGVLHVLFLVFAILGVSLWGISEFLLTAEEESRAITAESAAVVTETKRALLNYALGPPPSALPNVRDCGLQEERGCYNYYDEAAGAYAPYAPLTLPCPDLATDGNLDGGSDPGSAGCAAAAAGALEGSLATVAGAEVSLHHRLGRLPWREERRAGVYVRGLGNRDLRDGSAARLWYGVSRNVTPCVVGHPRGEECAGFEDGNAARSAQVLLALEDGWLTVEGLDESGSRVVLSDRVAAVVIAPGAAEGGQQRPDEDILLAGAGGPGATPGAATLAAVEHYLEGENADGDDVFFAYGGYGISLLLGDDAGQLSPTRHGEDHLEYITIEELVAAQAARSGRSAEGEGGSADDDFDLLGRAGDNPAVVAGGLLEGYYRRFGHYPDPAAFHADGGESKFRPPGIPRTRTRELGRGSGRAPVTLELSEAAGAVDLRGIPIRISDLPPVYLAPGWRFPDEEGSFENAPGFPFGESLARMKTRFSITPLQDLAGGSDYNSLYDGPGHVVDHAAVYGLATQDAAGTTEAVLNLAGPTGASAPFTFVSRAAEVAAEPGRDVEVILAAPLAVGGATLAATLAVGGESAPPEGLAAVLPAGTRLRLRVGSDVAVRFPAGLQVRGQPYREMRSLTFDLDGLLRAFPEISRPFVVSWPVFASSNPADLNAEIMGDHNGAAAGVGLGAGGQAGNIQLPGSRYAVRPRFLMAGGIPSYDASRYDPSIGFLSQAERQANIAGAAAAANSAHYLELVTVQVVDVGGVGGGAGLPANILTPEISFVNPGAWEFRGYGARFFRRDELPGENNGHLRGYSSDPALLQQSAAVAAPSFENVQAGTETTGGGRLRVEFDAWPFSRLLIHPQDNSAAALGDWRTICGGSGGCPYSGGFWAEEMVVRLVPDVDAYNMNNSIEVTGLELIEQTLLPARLVDRAGDSRVELAAAAPAGYRAATGAMGMAPAARAAAAMPEEFGAAPYYTAVTVEEMRSLEAAAVAHLYAPLAVAAAATLALAAFPPPGRPALRGGDDSAEAGLIALPGPMTAPAGRPIELPAGTRIIAPAFLPGPDNWLGRFSFGPGAVALLPPGSRVPAALRALQRQPDGQDGPATAATLMVNLPNGGMLALDGAWPLAGGAFGEMLEFEIRVGAVAGAADGGAIALRDGALVQPLTGRTIQPRPVDLPNNAAEIEAATRLRAKFLRRPHLAIRTGENQAPAYPLEDGAGVELTSQVFPANSFVGVTGPLELALDEDTEFLLPAGAFSYVAGRWLNNTSATHYGAADFERTGNAGFYYDFTDFSDSDRKRETAVTLFTLPAGTRIYDKGFQRPPLVAARGLDIPLAGNLGGPGNIKPGQAKFNFALFPEQDLVYRTGAERYVIPGGAVVDLAGRRVVPPVGAMRLPRVAGDLEAVSNAPMLIYLGRELGGPYLYDEPRTAAHGPDTAATQVEVGYTDIAGGVISHDSVAATLRAGRLELPAGAMVMIPPGDALQFHANYLLTLASETARSRIRLPRDAVAVIPDGLAARLGGAPIDGPAYVRLGGVADNGRAAAAYLELTGAVADIRNSGASFVLLWEPARLRGRPGARLDPPRVRIPAEARLDLYGNMEMRAERWFMDEMAPAWAAETIKETPMAYVVAPECRRAAAAEYDSCGQPDMEGLTFEIPPGEEVILPAAQPAPDIFRIEAADGGTFPASYHFLDDLPSDVQIPPTAVSFIYVEADGRARVRSASNAFDNMMVDNPVGRDYLVAYPPASGAALRVYLGVGEPPTDAADRAAELAASDYVDSMQPLTVYNGGYLGDDYDAAAARAELPVGRDFIVGAQTRIFDAERRPGAFGPGSRAELQFGPDSAEVDLHDYVPLNDRGARSQDFFAYQTNLGAQIAYVDDLGAADSLYRAAALLGLGPGPVREFLRSRAYQTRYDSTRPLRLAVGQTIAMEPGYLWQGFVPAGGVSLLFTRNDRLHRAYWPPSPESPEEALMQSRIHLRVHPADLALNFFGSGHETVEGLDGDAGGSAASPPARELLAMSEALFQEFAQSDYAPPANRALAGYRTPPAIGETVLLGPYNYQGAYDRPYNVSLNSSGPESSHGVNPNILRLPPDQRLSLISHHALRINFPAPNTDHRGLYQLANTQFSYPLGDAEARSYSAADPLFFANRILHSARPVPGIAGADPQLSRYLTVLPANGLKVRRVRLGLDPRGARLDLPNTHTLAAAQREFKAFAGAPDCPATFTGAAANLRFNQGPVPPYADPLPELYPGAPCPRQGRASHRRGFDAQFPLRATMTFNGNPESFRYNPPILAVVRDLNTGLARTITTHWHNFYGIVQTAGSNFRPDLHGRIVWGGYNGPFNSADPHDAPAFFAHPLPANSAVPDQLAFLYDQDWDFFSTAGSNQAASPDNLIRPGAGQELVNGRESNTRHVAVFSGPFSFLPPNHPDNIARSGLDDAALNGMCAVDQPGEYLRVPFSHPPLQLAALDIPPGLAWPRPGREHGTADLDKRIRGAFIPRADRPDMMPRLSPFSHADNSGNFRANAHTVIHTQNRFLRDPQQNLNQADYFLNNPPTHFVKSRPQNIPAARDAVARTADAGTPQTSRDIGPGETLSTEAFSELYLFMDRPHNPDFMGGQQGFIIGENFRVEGAAAVVPPFGAVADQAAADIMTQRSKIMTDLFNTRPLGESYSAPVPGGCQGVDPCPAAWNSNEWAPVLAGVIAMEAVNLNLQANLDVLDGVYFILPHPAEVQLTDNTRATLQVGSAIYPYRGIAIPAVGIAEDSQLVAAGQPADMVMDVSPVVAPTPVRIFREKTHESEHITRPLLINQFADFFAEIVVQNTLNADGSAPVFGDSCPAFLQGVPAFGEPNAIPGFPAATDAAALSIAATIGHLFYTDETDQPAPPAAYPASLAISSSVQKPAGAPNYQNLRFAHNIRHNLADIEAMFVNAGGQLVSINLQPPPPGVTIINIPPPPPPPPYPPELTQDWINALQNYRDTSGWTSARTGLAALIDPGFMAAFLNGYPEALTRWARGDPDYFDAITASEAAASAGISPLAGNTRIGHMRQAFCVIGFESGLTMHPDISAVADCATAFRFDTGATSRPDSDRRLREIIQSAPMRLGSSPYAPDFTQNWINAMNNYINASGWTSARTGLAALVDANFMASFLDGYPEALALWSSGDPDYFDSIAADETAASAGVSPLAGDTRVGYMRQAFCVIGFESGLTMHPDISAVADCATAFRFDTGATSRNDSDRRLREIIQSAPQLLPPVPTLADRNLIIVDAAQIPALQNMPLAPFALNPADAQVADGTSQSAQALFYFQVELAPAMCGAQPDPNAPVAAPGQPAALPAPTNNGVRRGASDSLRRGVNPRVQRGAANSRVQRGAANSRVQRGAAPALRRGIAPAPDASIGPAIALAVRTLPNPLIQGALYNIRGTISAADLASMNTGPNIARIPQAPGSAVRATIIVSVPRQYHVVPELYIHSTDGVLRFNNETRDIAYNQRGVIPANLQSSDPLYMSLVAACPNCQFNPGQGGGGPLEILVGANSTLWTIDSSSRRNVRVFQSYQLHRNIDAALDPNGPGVDLRAEFRRAGINAPNDFIAGGSNPLNLGDCRSRYGTDGDAACRFFDGTIRRILNAGGQEPVAGYVNRLSYQDVDYQIDYQSPPDLPGFRLDGFRALPPAHAYDIVGVSSAGHLRTCGANNVEWPSRWTATVTDPAINRVVLSAREYLGSTSQNSAGCTGGSLKQYELPLMPDGFDEDGRFTTGVNTTRSLSYEINGQRVLAADTSGSSTNTQPQAGLAVELQFSYAAEVPHVASQSFVGGLNGTVAVTFALQPIDENGVQYEINGNLSGVEKEVRVVFNNGAATIQLDERNMLVNQLVRNDFFRYSLFAADPNQEFPVPEHINLPGSAQLLIPRPNAAMARVHGAEFNFAPIPGEVAVTDSRMLSTLYAPISRPGAGYPQSQGRAWQRALETLFNYGYPHLDLMRNAVRQWLLANETTYFNAVLAAPLTAAERRNAYNAACQAGVRNGVRTDAIRRVEDCATVTEAQLRDMIEDLNNAPPPPPGPDAWGHWLAGLAQLNRGGYTPAESANLDDLELAIRNRALNNPYAVPTWTGAPDQAMLDACQVATTDAVTIRTIELYLPFDCPNSLTPPRLVQLVDLIPDISANYPPVTVRHGRDWSDDLRNQGNNDPALDDLRIFAEAIDLWIYDDPNYDDNLNDLANNTPAAFNAVAPAACQAGLNNNVWSINTLLPDPDCLAPSLADIINQIQVLPKEPPTILVQNWINLLAANNYWDAANAISQRGNGADIPTYRAVLRAPNYSADDREAICFFAEMAGFNIQRQPINLTNGCDGFVNFSEQFLFDMIEAAVPTNSAPSLPAAPGLPSAAQRWIDRLIARTATFWAPLDGIINKWFDRDSTYRQDLIDFLTDDFNQFGLNGLRTTARVLCEDAENEGITLAASHPHQNCFAPNLTRAQIEQRSLDLIELVEQKPITAPAPGAFPAPPIAGPGRRLFVPGFNPARPRPAMVAHQCVVEPLGFLPYLDVEYDHPDPAVGGNVRARMAPVANLRWHQSDSESRGYYPSRFEVLGGNVNEVRRYDGSWSRGFAATPRASEIFLDYYTGSPDWRTGWLGGLGGANRYASPARISQSQPVGGVQINHIPTGTPQQWTINPAPSGAALLSNEMLRLRNPLAYLWAARFATPHTQVVGARRLDPNDARNLVIQKVCGAQTQTGDSLREGIPQDFCIQMSLAYAEADFPYHYLPNSADNRRLGVFGEEATRDATPTFRSPRVRAPYTPLEVVMQPMGTSSARPVRALRLPHVIEIPAGTRFALSAGGLGYPGNDGYFAFPAGSRAMMMNIDMSSWESIHPGLVASRGGMTLSHVSGGATGVVNATPALASGENWGEAFSEYDFSGRAFLHYLRSEAAPAEEPTSARQVRANLWMRLAAAAELQTAAGARVRIPPNSVVNPVAATYVTAPEPDRRGNRQAQLNYASNARGAGGAALLLVRPALTLPKGAKLVVRSAGVRMTQVRAAVFYSPAPLPRTDCPVAPNGLNQLQTPGTPLPDGVLYSPGHPCALLDDDENLDGDRLFIYTNRPRWNSANTRIEANDRAALLGGRLEF